MATVLDTRKITRRLHEAGMADSQAEALLDSLLQLRTTDLSQLASKSDLAEVRSELTLVKWMLGVNLTLTVGVLLKLLLGA